MTPAVDSVVLTTLAANPAILPFAILSGLVLAAVALSLAVLCRARTLVRDAMEASRADHAHGEAAVESLRLELNGLAARLQEARLEVPPPAAPGLPRPGLNLSKRSQALRMHRRGDAPVEIASALGVPLQEIDLLLKVHRIVISNI
ncbi:MAG TPA: hypothetical protein VE959_14940 [Bryobacteraceae bacterium]|nr:conserved exported hypothetical protein [Candidatus Sulfopaludibacter sp. SbA4]HYW44155.1 hypothetical protein [Bryobacteraceae bacterium]